MKGLVIILFLHQVLADSRSALNRTCIQCDWKDDLCSWTADKSQPDGTATWNRIVSTPTSTSTCGTTFESSKVCTDGILPQASDVSTSALKCLSGGVELSPADYTVKSSFLQLYVGMPFLCDGEISAWRYVSAEGEPTRRFYASVWERSKTAEEGRTVFNLVGWNVLPPGTVDGWQMTTISLQDRIRVKKGQFIGLHYASLKMKQEDTVVPHYESDSKGNFYRLTVPVYTIVKSHSEIDQDSRVEVNQGQMTRRLPALVAIVTKKVNMSTVLGDNYLSAEAYPSKPLVGSAVLTSPAIAPTTVGHCLFFRYSLRGNGSVSSIITISLKLGDNRRGETLFTDSVDSGETWTSAWTKIARRTTPFSVIIDAKPASNGGSVAVGLVRLTQEPCLFTREVDIMTPAIRSRGEFILGTSMNNLWPNAKVPYEIDNDFSDEEIKMIKSSMDAFRSARSCINFLPHTDEQIFVRFKRPVIRCGRQSEPVCATSVGRLDFSQTEAGVQPVYLDKRCFYPQGNVIHQLAHLVGLWHETNRADQEQHVYINWENIAWDQRENLTPYTELGAGYVNTPFDYDSVTHFSEKEFANDYHFRTLAASDNTDAIFGQRYRLSAGDVRKIRAMYSAAPGCGTADIDETMDAANEPAADQLSTRRIGGSTPRATQPTTRRRVTTTRRGVRTTTPAYDEYDYLP